MNILPSQTTNPAVMLDARSISRQYGRRKVLVDVNLSLRAGELVGIVGENGSGKTTLLRILVGLDLPTTGVITSRASIGYCPQELMVFENLTVLENCEYFAHAYARHVGPGWNWAERVEELLQQFQFAQYERRLVRELSGGTRQKLNLSIALLHDPDVLILDEPHSGLDWDTYQRMWTVCEQRRAAGKSILMVSHLIQDARPFNSFLTLSNGVLHADAYGGRKPCP